LEAVPEEIITNRAKYNTRLTRLRKRQNALSDSYSSLENTFDSSPPRNRENQEKTEIEVEEENTLSRLPRPMPRMRNQPGTSRENRPTKSSSFCEVRTRRPIVRLRSDQETPRQSHTIPRKPTRTRSARIFDPIKASSMPNFTPIQHSPTDAGLVKLQADLLQVMKSFDCSD